MVEEKIRVLYLDDEINNLNSFKAAFRRRWEIYTALTKNEALDHLANQQIHVIISDQRMPEVTGVDFLETVYHLYEKPIRILMTGYADIEAVIQAINRGKVFHYISKPWNEAEVIKAIENAYKIFSIQEKKENESDFFLYKVSHDLKGPLISMTGLTNLIQQESGDQVAVGKYSNLISTSILRLNNILSELIDFKKIDQSVISPQSIDFKELIDNIRQSIQYRRNDTSIDFQIEINQVNSFYSDNGIIRSILQNLIENSIKYIHSLRDDPYVLIKVDVSLSSASIVIKDNGVGIDEELKKNMFKMFYRGQKDNNGSGLGLYIVKAGIDKLKGEIEVDSAPGKGTSFNISLPNMS